MSCEALLTGHKYVICSAPAEGIDTSEMRVRASEQTEMAVVIVERTKARRDKCVRARTAT